MLISFWLAAIVSVATAASAQTYSVIYSFAGGTMDGSSPTGALIQDSAGNVYGVTGRGGPGAAGTIFEVDPSGNETMLYAFTGGADGGIPLAGLFRDPEGNLYGTTSIAGDVNCQCGTVFKLDTSNHLTVLHQFTGKPDGASPGWSSQLISIDGELYSVTTRGGTLCGTGGCGVIFKISKGGAEHVVYRFTGGLDGAAPVSLIRDGSGTLYGSTATISGRNATIFKVDPSGSNFMTLFTFLGGPGGDQPSGRMIRDVNGNIHGVTYYGGKISACPHTGCGVVFHMDPSGNETVVHTFFGGANGDLPFAGLLDVGGVLYGTASEGGSTTECFPVGCGLLYQIGKTGQFSVLHRFTGQAGGAYPEGELLLGSDGSIYGTTSQGGTGGFGTIFKYTP